jgi:hypothetical protein
MVLSSLGGLRVFGSTFALVLFLMGSWVAGAEFMRPPPAPFPGTAAASAANERDRAGTAASIGVVRGDLWADYALALAGDVVGTSAVAAAATPGQIANARAAAERAATLAPHDGRLWLLLAMLDARPASNPGGSPGSGLEMSYFTAPYEADLIPVRILLAAKSPAIAGGDLKSLVEGEARFILTRRPEPKPAILAAYREGLPQARSVIEGEVGGLDETFLATLRQSR